MVKVTIKANQYDFIGPEASLAEVLCGVNPI